MASPTQFVARIRILTRQPPRRLPAFVQGYFGNQSLAPLPDRLPRHRVERLEHGTAQILCIFFRRHKCDGARAFSSLLDRQDVPLCVAMVIGKGSLAASRTAPVSEVAGECIRIAKPAESKEWAGSDFFGGQKRHLSCKAAEPKQSTR